MSLNFGIYLVEQRIISPEQFCGLVKIQQEATMSLPTIAIRKNLMTIKQVSRVLDIMETAPEDSFIQVALAEQLIDGPDADLMLHAQQMSCPAIRELVVECGLLTQRQSEVLFLHFEKQCWLKSQQQKSSVEEAEPNEETAPATAEIAEENRMAPRQPKFTQRPVIVQPFSNQVEN